MSFALTILSGDVSASGPGVANAVWNGGTANKAVNEAPRVTLASAATVNIGAAATNAVTITGTTTITAFDTIADGALREVTFSGALTLTHNATSLILPTAANISTAAGDVAYFRSLGSGNWRCTGYSKANGQPLAVLSGSGDFTQPLVNSEVSITGATTLTTSAFGKLHVCSDSATPANYTVTLPTAVGNTGSILAIRVRYDVTKFITIAAPGGQKLPKFGPSFMNTAVTSRVMLPGEEAILMSNGTDWMKIGGISIPMVGSMYVASGGQSISNATMTKVTYANADFGAFGSGTTDPFADVANNRFSIVRPGTYEFSGQCYFNYTSSSALMLVDVWANGSQIHEMAGYNTGAGQAIGKPGPIISGLSAGDYVDMRVYQATGSTQTLQGLASLNRPSFFNAKEMQPW